MSHGNCETQESLHSYNIEIGGKNLEVQLPLAEALIRDLLVPLIESTIETASIQISTVEALPFNQGSKFAYRGAIAIHRHIALTANTASSILSAVAADHTEIFDESTLLDDALQRIKLEKKLLNEAFRWLVRTKQGTNEERLFQASTDLLLCLPHIYQIELPPALLENPGGIAPITEWNIATRENIFQYLDDLQKEAERETHV